MQTHQQQTEQAERAAGFLGCDPEELLDENIKNGFSLEAVVSSKAQTMPPLKAVIYGIPGIGKTSFAATFPNPILLRFEDGASALDIPTFPKVLQSLQEFDQAFNALNAGGHGYKTLILDSLDWLEPLVWKYVCHKHGKESIESFGYGKGYIYVDDIWRNIHAKLEKLRCNHKMNIIAIAHAVPITVDLPDLEPYQRYAMKLHKRGTALWTEWADMILFVNYKVHVYKDSDNKNSKGKAAGSGERVIFTQERPAWQAKSRWPLDEEIHIGNDKTWSAFHQNLLEATGA